MFTAIVGAVCLAAGYVLRKFVEKRWPDKAHELDEAAQKAGDDFMDRIG